MATPNTYDLGSLVQLTGTFKNAAGALTNPTTVVCTVVDPASTTTTPAASNQSTGIYTATVDLTNATPGMWWYSFQGTGAVQANEWASFFVEAART